MIFEADKYPGFYVNWVYTFNPALLPQAHDYCKRMVESAMDRSKYEHGYDKLVVSNTFTQEWEMKPYFDLAKKYGYRVHTLIVENRHGNKSIHDVPDESIEKMKKRFEIKL